MDNSSVGIEQEYEMSLQDQYILSKRKEKKLIFKIHCQNQEIEELKAAIEHLKSQPCAKSPEKIDLVFDRLVNNELNALIEAKNALETKIEDVKLNIIRKKIEKSEGGGGNEEIGERYQRNEELGKKIGKAHFEYLQSEIDLYKNFVEELKDEKKKIASEIVELESEQKNENETISSCKRMLRDQELKNAKLQKEIDELKEEFKIK